MLWNVEENWGTQRKPTWTINRARDQTPKWRKGLISSKVQILTTPHRLWVGVEDRISVSAFWDGILNFPVDQNDTKESQVYVISCMWKRAGSVL